MRSRNCHNPVDWPRTRRRQNRQIVQQAAPYPRRRKRGGRLCNHCRVIEPAAGKRHDFKAFGIVQPGRRARRLYREWRTTTGSRNESLQLLPQAVDDVPGPLLPRLTLIPASAFGTLRSRRALRPCESCSPAEPAGPAGPSTFHFSGFSRGLHNSFARTIRMSPRLSTHDVLTSAPPFVLLTSPIRTIAAATLTRLRNLWSRSTLHSTRVVFKKWAVPVACAAGRAEWKGRLR